MSGSVTPPAAGMALLSARGLSKTYRRGPERIHAVRDVDLEIRAGELVAIVGPSGSGKTTLLNLLAGWEHPDAGTVTWRGELVALAELPWRESAFIPQDLALLEELPVGENVAMPLRLGGGGSGRPADRVDLAAAALGLTGLMDRMPSELSLGEQQRVAMARALVADPALVLADEPTAHQDEVWGKQLMDRIRAAAGEATAFVIATHDPELVGRLDRVHSMRDGRLARA